MSLTLKTTVGNIRRFNRFYTREIGVLEEGHLKSPYTLVEVRILFELSQPGRYTAAEISRHLNLDKAQLSRSLARLEERGLIRREASESDGRERILQLTQEGQSEILDLNQRADQEIARLVEPLSAEEQSELRVSLEKIEQLLKRREAPITIRPHQIGDLGWVVERHGILYSREFGWNSRFEALVAEIAADFLKNFDPLRERCWIAQAGEQRVGSILCVKEPEQEGVARLRLLLVESAARGRGLGRLLVRTCVQFARDCGYRKLVLWTNSVLTSAARIYAEEGFRIVDQCAHSIYGQPLMGQNWELELRETPRRMTPTFNQVNLVVKDLEATIDFYRKLGVVLPTPGATQSDHLEVPVAPGFHVAFDSLWLAREYDPERLEGDCTPILGVRLPTRQDVDSHYKTLVSEGYRARLKPHDAFWGSRYAILVDPDGHLVGISSPSDVQRQSIPSERQDGRKQ